VPRDINSQPLEDAFPKLRGCVVACAACGRLGRDAHVDWENFRPPGFGPWITEAVSGWYPILPLAGTGFCHACSSGGRIAANRPHS
jgi:hypothetical protein